jgi:hypothetical protein
MRNLDDDSWVPTRRDAYSAYLSFAQKAEETAWVRFNNFLLSGSILIVAWSTIYSTSHRSKYDGIVMASMSGLGLVNGFVWRMLGVRSRWYVYEFLKKGGHLEKDAKADCRECELAKINSDEFRFRWLAHYATLIYAPLLFACLYAVLLYVSVMSFFPDP